MWTQHSYHMDTTWFPGKHHMYYGVWGGHKAGMNQPVLDSRRRHRPGVNNSGAILMDLFVIY